MPEPTWRAEVTATLFAPSPDDLADPTTGCTYSAYFSAGDDFNAWGIAITALPHAPALVGYRLRYEFYINAFAGTDPNTWSLVSGVNTVDVDDEVFVFSVITLAIEKNYDADTLTYIIPDGSHTYVKALSGFIKDTSTLRPTCEGDGIVLPSGTEASGGSVCFTDFFGYRNSAKFLGAAETALDPGTWTLTAEYTTGINPAVPNTDVQSGTCYIMAFQQSIPPAPRAPTRRTRCWDGGDNLAGEAERWYVDAVVSPITGTVLVAVTTGILPGLVTVYRSTDNGDTFDPVPVVGPSAQMFSWLNIMIDPRGRVVLFFNNGMSGEVEYAVSETDGLTWITGTTYDVRDLMTGQPTTLLYPRYRIDPFGVIWGVWNSRELQTILGQRYPVLGDDPLTAFFVDTGVDDPVWPDLFWLGKGEARIFYRYASDGRLRASDNFGESWFTVLDGRTFDARQSSVSDRKRGITAHILQSLLDTSVQASISPDGNETFTSGLGDTILATADFQYPSIAQGQRGQFFVFVWEGAGSPLTLHCYRSEMWTKNFTDTGATFL